MVIKPEYGSDIMLDLLRKLDIKYISLNPGSSLRGIHDSVVNYGNNKHPELILCCHENIAVSIAAGYGLASGKPMAAMVHNIVGLLNATNATYNAWLAGAPVLILGATGPTPVEDRRPWIDWIHTALVQGNVVRDYVKWDDQPASLSGVGDSLLRGYQIAVTETQGPVYICLDAALQEQDLSNSPQAEIPAINEFALPTPSYPAPEAIEQAAKLLTKAQKPVVLVELLPDSSAMKSLIELAELLSLPVVDRGRSINFPTSHPLNMRGTASQVLNEADVVLALNIYDLFQSLTGVDRESRRAKPLIKDTAKVIDISLRHMTWRSWSQAYGRLQATELSITSDAGNALPALVSQCKKLSSKQAASSQIQVRKKQIEEIGSKAKKRWEEQAQKAWKDTPVSLPRLASELWQVVKDEDWVLASHALNEWVWRIWDFNDPSQCVRREGLGCAIGNAIGTALYYKDSGKLVVDIQPDGDFLFAASSLWTVAHYRIPLLIVMFNNRSYYNDEAHQETVAITRKRPVENKGIGLRIEDPPVDFATLARSFGIYGQGPIEEPAKLRSALEKAVKYIKKEKRAALIDVVTQPR